MAEQTKIEPCPYCGKDPRAIPRTYLVSCKTFNCRMFTLRVEIMLWNALCADIERGREAKTIRTALIGLAGDFAKSEALAGKAVRLLKMWGFNTNNKDCVTECNCCQSGFGYHDAGCQIGDYLKLPAVAKIIAAQKDGGEG